MKKAELLAEQERLLGRANELAQFHWGVDYTGTLRLVNRDWRIYNGYFVRSPEGLQEIVMSAQKNAKRPPEDVERTLLHELVHWRQYLVGQPARDTDFEFIAECLRVGASISKGALAQAAFDRYQAEVAS